MRSRRTQRRRRQTTASFKKSPSPSLFSKCCRRIITLSLFFTLRTGFAISLSSSRCERASPPLSHLHVANGLRQLLFFLAMASPLRQFFNLCIGTASHLMRPRRSLSSQRSSFEGGGCHVVVRVARNRISFSVIINTYISLILLHHAR